MDYAYEDADEEQPMEVENGDVEEEGDIDDEPVTQEDAWAVIRYDTRTPVVSIASCCSVDDYRSKKRNQPNQLLTHHS
jgi:hypothetical protein